MTDPHAPDLHAAILAAGPSTRFGSPKQLVRVAGAPVLHQAITIAAAVAGRSVSVVLGSSARDIAPALRQKSASIVVNRDWEEGVASSIRAAVHSTPAGCDGLLLLLADQVTVTVGDVQRLYAAWRRHPVLITAALYDGAPGLPAIFPPWSFTDLLDLRGDCNPRMVMRRNVDRIVRVPMANASVDLDTPEDLLEVETRASAGSDT